MRTEEARRRRAAYERRRKSKRRRTKQLVRRVLLCVGTAAAIILAVWFITSLLHKNEDVRQMAKTKGKIVEQPEFEVQLLTPNPYSRPQLATEKLKGIVVHYTANPGTTAQQNRDYFEGLKDSKSTKASSHFIIGISGEIIQCIPSSEVAYASNNRNYDTISIECCHKDETGEFTKETYDSLVHLVAWLCGKFDLAPEDVIRHYDVTEKKCPLYFVEHEDKWKKFKQDVVDYIDKYGTEKEQDVS